MGNNGQVADIILKNIKNDILCHTNILIINKNGKKSINTANNNLTRCVEKLNKGTSAPSVESEEI